MTARAIEAQNGSAPPDAELARVIHEEIGLLPERFRSAVVLCYLEGLTHETAAERLGRPVGTVRSRLATARDRLRVRLTRRGATPAISDRLRDCGTARIQRPCRVKRRKQNTPAIETTAMRATTTR